MTARRDTGPVLCVAAVLFAVVFLLYAQVTRHAFVEFDDRQYVSQNPHVLQGLTAGGIRWAFTTTQESNWHPLTWIAHMLDTEFFGVSPAASHLTNVFLHALNAVLLFLVFFRMTGAIGPPAVVALLFAIHPLRVESVAWASARKDVLSGLFFFVTLLAYHWYTQRRSVGRYSVVVVAFALGLMSKPMLVTLPAVLLLLDVWPLRRLRWPVAAAEGRPRAVATAVFLEKLPLFALSAASCVVTFVCQKSGGSVLPADTAAPAARLANAVTSYGLYLLKTVWPTQLAILYPHPALVPAGAGPTPIASATLAALAVAILSAAVWYAGRRLPYFAVGWLWYLGTLLPVIGIVQVGFQALADRYTYLPLIGVYVMVVWGLRDLIAARPSVKPFVQLGAAAALPALAVLTWFQVATWKDTLTLYRHALSVTESNFVIHNNLGTALPENSAESEAEYRRSIAIKPDFADAHYNLGTVLQSREDLAGARSEYETALRTRPEWFEPRNNLAVVLLLQGDRNGALAQWRELVRLNPNSARAHATLGRQFLQRGETAAAIAELEQAARIDPRDADARDGLAEAKKRQGNPAEVLERFKDAAQARPYDVEAQFNLGVAAMRANRPAEAQRIFEELARTRPDEPQVRNALAAALAQQGKLREAEREFEAALELNPTFEKALAGLAKVRRMIAARSKDGTPPERSR